MRTSLCKNAWICRRPIHLVVYHHRHLIFDHKDRLVFYHFIFDHLGYLVVYHRSLIVFDLYGFLSVHYLIFHHHHERRLIEKCAYCSYHECMPNDK